MAMVLNRTAKGAWGKCWAARLEVLGGAVDRVSNEPLVRFELHVEGKPSLIVLMTKGEVKQLHDWIEGQ